MFEFLVGRWGETCLKNFNTSGLQRRNLHFIEVQTNFIIITVGLPNRMLQHVLYLLNR